MKKILYIMLLTVVATLWSCEQKLEGSTAAQVFVQNNTLYGVYIEGRQIFVVDDNKHQQCVGVSNYRIQTDDQSVYLNIYLSRIPTTEGDQTSLTFTAQGIPAIKNGQSMFKMLKSESGSFWFWNEVDKMGVIIPSSVNM